MTIESIGEQYDRALKVERTVGQIEAEQARVRLFALAKYNAPRMRLGLPDIRIIAEFDRLKLVGFNLSQEIPMKTEIPIDRIPVTV